MSNNNFSMIVGSLVPHIYIVYLCTEMFRIEFVGKKEEEIK